MQRNQNVTFAFKLWEVAQNTGLPPFSRRTSFQASLLQKQPFHVKPSCSDHPQTRHKIQVNGSFYSFLSKTPNKILLQHDGNNLFKYFFSNSQHSQPVSEAGRKEKLQSLLQGEQNLLWKAMPPVLAKASHHHRVSRTCSPHHLHPWALWG